MDEIILKTAAELLIALGYETFDGFMALPEARARVADALNMVTSYENSFSSARPTLDNDLSEALDTALNFYAQFGGELSTVLLWHHIGLALGFQDPAAPPWLTVGAYVYDPSRHTNWCVVLSKDGLVTLSGLAAPLPIGAVLRRMSAADPAMCARGIPCPSCGDIMYDKGCLACTKAALARKRTTIAQQLADRLAARCEPTPTPDAPPP